MNESVSFMPALNQREKLFKELYKKAFPSVARHISKMGGSFEQAKDVFQDALVAFYEKNAGNPAFVINPKAYIIGTARNLWLKRYHEGSKELPLTDSLYENLPEDITPAFFVSRIAGFLKMGGRKCLEILRAAYYDNLSADEIAEQLGYSGAHSATVKKYKCLEKLRDLVKEKSLHYEDFVE